MRYTGKFSVEIPIKEFYEYAKPKPHVTVKELHKAIRNELYHSFQGITGSDWGGEAINWKKVFYFELWSDGYIEQTQKGIEEYGDFSKNISFYQCVRA